MHKSEISAKKIPKKSLKRAMRDLEWMGLFYQSRKHFWEKQAPIIQKYLTDPDTSKKILRSVKRFMRAVKIKTKVPDKVKAKYECPRLEMTIYSPCQEKSCEFWGNFPSQLNCASKYMKEQGRNTLTVAEMGIFSEYSRAQVNNILHGAMIKLRRNAFHVIGVEVFGSKKNGVSLDDKICCVCNKPTDNPKGLFSTKADAESYTYCSFNCWSSKQPSKIFIEHNLGGSFIDILHHLPRRYNDLDEAAKCLTVQTRKLENLLWSETPDNSLLKDIEQPILQHRDRGKRFWEKEKDKWEQKAKNHIQEAIAI